MRSDFLRDLGIGYTPRYHIADMLLWLRAAARGRWPREWSDPRLLPGAQFQYA